MPTAHNHQPRLPRCASVRQVGRHIPSGPSRILDAPELVDDYYLNLISWGSMNVLAVALGQCVYLWNAANGNIDHLLTLDGADDYVTSVSWAGGQGCGHYLAVGTNSGATQLWDAKELKLVRTMGGHTQRVGSLAWNKNWLSSGGRDGIIVQHDVRSANHTAAVYSGHKQEVCGLAWNDDGGQLASGGNENYLCLWDASMSRRRSGVDGGAGAVAPRLTLSQHCAAVKALAWCPFHRGLLASGGGTADRTIKVRAYQDREAGRGDGATYEAAAHVSNSFTPLARPVRGRSSGIRRPAPS